MIDEYRNAKVEVKEGPYRGKVGHVFCIEGEFCDVYLVSGVTRVPKKDLEILSSNL